MFYYKKVKSGIVTGLISSSCEQPESENLVEINELEFKTIQEELKPAPHIPTYADLRRAAYPPWQDYNDAKVKQASTDPAIQAEGLAQEQEYLATCLAVKAAIPKV